MNRKTSSSLSIEPKRIVLKISEVQNGIDLEVFKKSISILNSMAIIIAMDDLDAMG